MAAVLQRRRSSQGSLMFTPDNHQQPHLTAPKTTSISHTDLALTQTATMTSTSTTTTQGTTTLGRRTSRTSIGSAATKFWRRLSVGSGSGISTDQDGGAVIMEENTGAANVNIGAAATDEHKPAARRRSSAKPKQVVADLTQQLIELRRQLDEEDEARAELERSLREAEEKMAVLEQAVGQTGEKAHIAKVENEKLKGESEALVGKLKELNVSVETVEKSIVTERRASETVYGWYMGLMLENEAIRMKLESTKNLAP